MKGVVLMRSQLLFIVACVMLPLRPTTVNAFVQPSHPRFRTNGSILPTTAASSRVVVKKHMSTTSLHVVQDLNVIGLVAGQENYGLAVVCVGEALWSFVQAPSLSHARILIPAAVAALVLVVVSGPMITSGDVSSVATGLWIATAVSTGLGVSYVARLLAPYSPSSKEVAALGLLVAIAGFFSFAQNLVVDGFVSLPSLPSLSSLPSIEFPELNFDLDASSVSSSSSSPGVPEAVPAAATEGIVESISAASE